MRPLACRLLMFAAAMIPVMLPASLPGAEMAPGSAPRPAEIRLKHGDDPRWAAPDWDDRDWEKLTSGFPARAGIYWARVRVARGYIDPRPVGRYSFAWPSDQPMDAVFMGSAFSFELYWDGRLLERSGTVGNSRAEEVPGPLDHLVRIPDELLGPGEHVVALRMSSHHYNFPSTQFNAGFAFTQFVPRLIYESRQPIVPLMLLAGALLMAATSLVMFLFTERRRSLLLCSGLSFALVVFYGLIAFRWLYNAPYDWHAPRLRAIAATTGVISLLLPWLLAEQFAVLRRGQWLVLLAPLLVAGWYSSTWYELKALWMCRAMLAVSLGIVGWATWQRRAGARWVLAALAVTLFLVQTSSRSFLDPFFFFMLEGLVLFVFTAVGLQVQADRRRARELSLTAARLETELLKKNIQPHFLLNTLATIIEMIEQTPRSAVALIEALASEFRILARVSGEKLIPLAQELELCRAHLRIMSLRKGVQCSLEARGVDEQALVPPALFHTLIENGLTHLAPKAGEQNFELRIERRNGVTNYVMIARGMRPGSAGGSPASNRTVGESRAHPAEGTGTRYIKARLEESFTGGWTLRAGPIEGGWQTQIDIRETSDLVPPYPILEPGRGQPVPSAAK